MFELSIHAWLVLLAALVGSFAAIFVAIPLAYRLKLVDTPCERKRHAGNIPLIGGVAVYLGVLMAVKFWVPESTEFNIYLLASGLIVFIGVLDDRYDLSVNVRLAAQVLVACIMIFGADQKIDSLGNLFGFGEVKLGGFAEIFTVVAVLGAINAFNMIDGIDGLLGSLSIVSLVTLAVLFIANGASDYSLFPIIIAVALVPFLLVNLQLFSKRWQKIFMGDAGSMYIGLSVIWALAYGSQPHTAPAGGNPAGEKAVFPAVMALWVVAIPLMDMAAIMVRRVRKGESAFQPDRDHFHHICMRAGLSARKSLALITSIAAALSAGAVYLHIQGIPEWLMLVFFLVLFTVYSYIIQHAWVVSKLVRNLAKV